MNWIVFLLLACLLVGYCQIVHWIWEGAGWLLFTGLPKVLNYLRNLG